MYIMLTIPPQKVHIEGLLHTFQFADRGVLTYKRWTKTSEAKVEVRFCAIPRVSAGGRIQNPRFQTTHIPFNQEKLIKMFTFHNS